MVQRSAREEDSLVSQRKEYEKMLGQQRGLYGEKMSELEKLHSQRKVSEWRAASTGLLHKRRSYSFCTLSLWVQLCCLPLLCLNLVVDTCMNNWSSTSPESSQQRC